MPPLIGVALDYDIVFRGIDNVSAVVGGIAGVVAGLVQSTVTQAAGLQTALNQVQANTTLTSQQMVQMKADVLAMNTQTGAPLDQLTRGMMLVADVGFNVGDSAKIMQAAMAAALPTGADLGTTAGILAMQMHDFGAGADQASAYMNTLRLASADSRTTMQEFADSTSKAVTMAANLKLPVEQADATLAALTLHMGGAAQASTALAGFFSKLADPAVGTEAKLKALGNATGIDLVDDFTAAGLQAKGLPGVLQDLAKATDGNVTEMLQLVPAMRGGIAEMVLLGSGSADFARILQGLHGTMSGTTNPDVGLLTQYLNSFNGQLGIVQAEYTQFLIAVGTPIIDTLSPVLANVVTYMDAHKADVTAFGKAIGTDIGKAVTDLVTEIVTHKTDIETFVNDFAVTLNTGVSDLIKNLPILVTDLGTSAQAVGAFGQQMAPVISMLGAYFSFQGTVLHDQLGIAGAIGSGVGNASRDLGNAATAVLGHGTASAASTHVPLSPIDPVTGKPYVVPHTHLPVLTPFSGATGSAAPVSSVERDAAGNIIAYGGGGPAYYPPPGAPPAPAVAQTRTRSTVASATGSLHAGPGLPDLTALNKTLTDAKDQFTLDRINGASQTVLLQDIKTIMADMKAVGDSGVAIRLEHAQDLQAITKATKTTATHAATESNALAGYRLQQQAGYGQSIVSFGIVQQANAQAMIAQLQAQLTAAQQRAATDDRQVALLHEEVAVLKQLTGHSATTAQSTKQVADVARKPAASLASVLRPSGTALAVR